MRDGLAFVSTEDWSTQQTIADFVGNPPTETCGPPRYSSS
jgi:hypothetical protein